MITVRKSEARGHFDHDWLKTYHTFSFADYQDPTHIQFHTLRVINEDWVAPSEGFDTHSHRDMEIVTYVLEGALEHKDSLGTTSVIRPGEVQRMSAGTGVTHSEFNHSDKEPVHLLQIWIFPAEKNLPPSYEQKFFEPKGKKNQLRLIVSQEGSENSIKIHQDALIYGSFLEKTKSITYPLKQNRSAWVQVIKGELKLNGDLLKAGDGASATDEKLLQLVALQPSEFLLFDLA
ncbi:MAG: pirin family protein [Candidatus Omnitrophica bacterium]|nr:pirin family protein [Candidatus Omnitrophota bacterium]